MDFVNITTLVIDDPSSPASNRDAVYNVTIDDVGNRASSSGTEYALVTSLYIGRSRYTVDVNGPSAYTVKRHISSSLIGTITFSVEVIVDKCMIRREYGSPRNVTTHYSILKAATGWELGCCHDDVLYKVKGYTKPKLDADACMAFDAGFFALKLVAMLDDEWVKVDAE